ncbi:hypothetical protein AALB53_13880 [Lachnospiraceae bacterium 47-T17]
MKDNGFLLKVGKRILLFSIAIIVLFSAKDVKQAKYSRQRDEKRKEDAASKDLIEDIGDEDENEESAGFDFTRYAGAFTQWYTLQDEIVSKQTGDYLFDVAKAGLQEGLISEGTDTIKTYSDDTFLVYDFKVKNSMMLFKISNLTYRDAGNVELTFEFDTGDISKVKLEFVPSTYIMISSIAVPNGVKKFRLKQITAEQSAFVCGEEYSLLNSKSKIKMIGENTLKYNYKGFVLLIDKYGFVHEFVEFAGKGKYATSFGLIKYAEVEAL